MSPKRAERLQVMLTIDEVRRVEEWRYEHRMPSRSAAVRALMNLGLRAHAAIDQSALLEGSVHSQDVGVTENGPLVETGQDGPAVLVVAGDRLVGQGLGRLLEQAGFHVVGPAQAGKEAQALASRDGIAAAVIDIASEADAARGIAESLAERRIPFVVVTDGGERAAPPGCDPSRMLSRASAEKNLVPMLAELIR